MPTYTYNCKCGETKEIVQSIKADRPDVKCSKCSETMVQEITGGVMGFMGPQTIGSLSDKNTSTMSLDHKIDVATRKYKDVNPLLKRDIAEADKKANIEREIREVTQGHNS